MSNLQRYNKKFQIDIDGLIKSNALEALMANPSVIKFHLLCAASAFKMKNNLRFLPDPQKYFPVLTKSEMDRFIVQIGYNDEVESYLKINDIKISAEKSLYKVTTQEYLLYFTVFTCDLKIIPSSISSNLFIVEQHEQKEEEFHEREGQVTYLIHRTQLNCLYSICRNGIKSMSAHSLYRLNGNTYGNGIYFADPRDSEANYGSVTLYYAVKNANRYQIGHSSTIYVVKEESDICLRAIAVNTSADANTVISCIGEHFDNKKH